MSPLPPLPHAPLPPESCAVGWKRSFNDSFQYLTIEFFFRFFFSFLLWEERHFHALEEIKAL